MTSSRRTTTTDHHDEAHRARPRGAGRPVAAPREPAGPVRRAGLVGGVALTLLAALAGFGNLVAVQGLVTPGDAVATAEDILASEGVFRLGVASLYLAALLDVVVAWALLRVFRPVDRELSRLAAWLRLAYAAVFLVALGQLAGIPALLNGGGGGSATRQAAALAKVDSFQDIWSAGLLLFGAHLVVVGYLAWRSGYVPRVIGALVVVAGAGYAFDSVAGVLLDDAPAVSTVTFLGELLLGLWLLVRGRRISPQTTSPQTTSRRTISLPTQPSS
jgi:hypothetical protein